MRAFPTTVKALAIAAATVTVGGVAFASSVGNLPTPFTNAARTTIVQGTTTSADTDGHNGPAAKPSAHPTGAPAVHAQSDTAKGDGDGDGPSADHRDGDHPGAAAGSAVAAQVKLAIACQIWTRGSDPVPVPLPAAGAVRMPAAAGGGSGQSTADRTTGDKSAAARLAAAKKAYEQAWAKQRAALVAAAGGQDKVLSYCAGLTSKLCATWPPMAHTDGVTANGATPRKTTQKMTLVADRCPFDLDHKGFPTVRPLPRPTVIHPMPPVPAPMPIKPAPENGNSGNGGPGKVTIQPAPAQPVAAPGPASRA